MRSFVKIKLSLIGDITLSFTDIGKKCHNNRDFFTWLMCLLTRFEKIKFTQKFPNLQYNKSGYNGNPIWSSLFTIVSGYGFPVCKGIFMYAF